VLALSLSSFNESSCEGHTRRADQKGSPGERRGGRKLQRGCSAEHSWCVPNHPRRVPIRAGRAGYAKSSAGVCSGWSFPSARRPSQGGGRRPSPGWARRQAALSEKPGRSGIDIPVSAARTRRRPLRLPAEGSAGSENGGVEVSSGNELLGSASRMRVGSAVYNWTR
jgi:hypothetical protein